VRAAIVGGRNGAAARWRAAAVGRCPDFALRQSPVVARSSIVREGAQVPLGARQENCALDVAAEPDAAGERQAERDADGRRRWRRWCGIMMSPFVHERCEVGRRQERACSAAAGR
jgi:hypothetical protein